jgi:ABC-2 type transport system ATP-binding protein
LCILICVRIDIKERDMTAAVIQTNNLSRTFGEKTAVDQLNLEVYPGEVFGFLGHNGAGKTTTVRLLNGVLNPTGGEVRVLGLSPQADGPALRARTGVLTETPSLDERLTARENLSIYADLYDVPEAKVDDRVAEALALFDLSDRADEKAGGYSRGMKQRLALARALLHRPELIFLDEPTSGLDPVSSRAVNTLIHRLSREEGRTVFLCTHNLAEAQQVCDRVGVMEQGRLVALGTPSELTAQLGDSQRVELTVAEENLDAALAMLPDAQLKNGRPGERTLLVSGLAYACVPETVAKLAAAQVKMFRVAPVEATLEDVYFSIHNRK